VHFRSSSEVLPIQGWKIHLSSTVNASTCLLEHVLLWAREWRFSFKVPGTFHDVVALNSGAFGRSQAGKVLTIYPRDDQEACLIATELDEAWNCPRAPIILTDLRLHCESSVYLRYGQIDGGLSFIDSRGRQRSALKRPDGALIEDQRSLDGTQPLWAAAPVVDSLRPSPFPDEFRLGNENYLIGALIYESAKGSVYLGANSKWHRRIIKVAQTGIAEDVLGYDACNRLDREFRCLSDLESAGITVPKVFAINADYPRILILEDIEGEVLDELPRERAIASLPALASAVADLHAAGYAHRDVKPGNAILSGNKVYLIDFELAARIGEKSVPVGGTKGFVSPEMGRGCAAAYEDVFALGACIAHVFLGVNPGWITGGSQRLPALLSAMGAAKAARLARMALNREPTKRPNAAGLGALLREICCEPDPVLTGRLIEIRRKSCNRWTRQILRKVAEAASAADAFFHHESEGHSWRGHETPSYSNATFERGAAGILVGLASIDTAFNSDRYSFQILQGAKWLASRPVSSPACGLFTGEAGVALALAIAGRRLGRPEFVENARGRLRYAAEKVVETDLFSGAPGVLWSGCLIASVVKQKWPLELVERLYPVVDHAVETAFLELAEKPAAWRRLSAVSGVAGMALALACWGQETGARKACNISLDAYKKVFNVWQNRTSRTQPGDNAWSTGISGLIWSVLQCPDHKRDLSEQLDWAFELFRSYWLAPCCAYHHGMASNLEVWNMLSTIPRYSKVSRSRAAISAQLLLHLGFRREAKWVWAVDGGEHVNPGLWNGFIGPACALARYAKGFKEPLLSISWLSKVSATHSRT